MTNDSATPFEEKIGQGKSRYGLGLIREKLAATQGSSIAINILVMKLQKLLEHLFVFFDILWWLLVSSLGSRGRVRRA
jgi:IS5 family transposase